MTRDYWAVAFADTSDSYLWIGWDQTVKESELPPALGFRMLLFNTRREARKWVWNRNVSMLYWTGDSHYLCVKRVRVTVAPPPRIVTQAGPAPRKRKPWLDDSNRKSEWK